MISKNLRSGTISKPQKQKKNETLQIAEEWQRTFDAINSAVWILDKDQQIIRSNKATEFYFKRKQNEIIGKQCWEVVHGTSQPVPECSILRARESLKRETMNLKIGERWFEVTVDPMLDANGHFNGAVHIVSDITDHKRAEEELIAAKEYAENLIRTANAMIIGLNSSGDIIVFNKAAEKITGYKRKELEGRNWFEVLVPKDCYPDVWKEFNQLKGGRIPVEFENPILSKSGEERIIVWQNNVLRHKGKITGTISFGIDITDRKRAETRINKLNRTYALLSNVNQMIVRVHEPLELFNEACRITVEQGGFQMVWIGLLDPKTKQVNPVAHAGTTNGYLEKINIRLDDSNRSLGPTATALNSGKYVVVNDIANDPRMAPWRDDALQLGFRSSAAFPIIVSGKVNGTLNMYSPEVNFFDENEQKLLEEMTTDIAFSLEFFEQEEKRKQAEEKLRNSEAFLNNIIDQNPYGYWVSDDKGNLIRINQACCELLNISESDVVGKYNVFKDNIVKEQGILPLIQSVFTKGETVRFEINYNTSKLKSVKLQQQASVILDTTVFPIKDTNGKVINAVIQHVNITGRKQTEKELQKYHEHLEELVKERTNKLEQANIELQSEINERKRIEEELARERNMLKTLIDNIPDEIYAKDNESRFVMANSHVIKSLWKNKLEEVIGKTDFNVLPYEQALKYYNDEQALLKSNKQMINYETSKREENGEIRWYSITKVPLLDSENKISGLVGINRDITMFKLAEEGFKKAKEAAVAANIAKSTFLSSMSHEIRTPLNAILGFSQLMLHDENLTRDQKEYLGTINKSGEHLLTLINDILEISKIEAGRAALTPSVFNLHSIINDIETIFRIKTDAKQLSLLIEYPEDLPNFIVTDEGKLRQILINIVGNAVKFTDEGGIAIRVYADNIENGKSVLIIEVEDTGPGISEKDIKKLFNMFGQTESGIKEGGTGLGLVISREYAKMMDGDITVKSEINIGSCFTIKIIIEKNNEVLPVLKNRRKRVTGIESGQKYKVLIVDDQLDNRVLLNKILTSVGFELNEANDGKEAVEKYKAWSPDIIIMDMRMPVMDGYEATRKIKAIDKKIPIIAVTASAFYEDRVKALEAGADKYLRKPFKGEELFEHIKAHLGVRYVYEKEK